MTRATWLHLGLGVLALAAIIAALIAFKRVIEWQTKATMAIGEAEASGRRLDSMQVVIDTLRARTSRKDTAVVVRLRWLHDTIPTLIAAVDSAACAPVIFGLRECEKTADSAKAVADSWHAIADSAGLRAQQERARGDSLLATLNTKPGRWAFGLPRPRCVKGAGPGYDVLHNQASLVVGLFCGF